MNSGTGIYKSGVLAFFCRSYPNWCAFGCCYFLLYGQRRAFNAVGVFKQLR